MYSAKNVSDVSVGHRLLLWSGVMRRFLLYVFNKKYVKANALKCQGECLRCGACCKLALKQCPYLAFDECGKSSCTKYDNSRMPNCVVFPIDDRDIKERDIVSSTPCGFSFAPDDMQ